MSRKCPSPTWIEYPVHSTAVVQGSLLSNISVCIISHFIYLENVLPSGKPSFTLRLVKVLPPRNWQRWTLQFIPLLSLAVCGRCIRTICWGCDWQRRFLVTFLCELNSWVLCQFLINICAAEAKIPNGKHDSSPWYFAVFHQPVCGISHKYPIHSRVLTPLLNSRSLTVK